MHKLVPFTALIYDTKGGAFVYVSDGILTYHRVPVTVAYTEQDTAYLTAGPPFGALVVSRGPGELYGAETGVGK